MTAPNEPQIMSFWQPAIAWTLLGIAFFRQEFCKGWKLWTVIHASIQDLRLHYQGCTFLGRLRRGVSGPWFDSSPGLNSPRARFPGGSAALKNDDLSAASCTKRLVTLDEG